MENRKVKKFLLSLIMVFMCAVTIFSGCSLVQTNTNHLANKTCAEFGDIKVTRQELVNYYYNAYSQGYRYEVKELLNELINQKILIEQVKSNLAGYLECYGEELENENGTTLKDIKNKYFYNQAMQKAYDYIDSKILEYENLYLSLHGKPKIEDNGKDSDTDYKAESPYESKVEIVDGVFVVKKDKVDFEDTLISDYQYDHIIHGDASLRTLAYNRFIAGLIRNEKGKGLDTNPENVLKREIERVYKIYEEQQYLDFFKEDYMRNLPVDNEAVVNRFKQSVLESYSKFKLEGNTDVAYQNYVTAMQKDASAVFYHPYENVAGKGFVKVAHILIKFTDDQLQGENENIDSLKQLIDKKDSMSADEFDRRYNEWLETCVGKARYTLEDEKLNPEHKAGNEYGEAKSYREIFAEITAELSATTDVTKRAEIINKFIYKYGQDEGSLNASVYYTVSIDDGVTESWAGDFAKTVREVYSNQGAGGYSDAFLLTNVVDSEGNYTFNDKSYAGMDMVFVVGEYKNLCDIGALNSLDENYAITLYNTRVMEGVESKSLYDLMYDSLTLSDYTKYRKGKLDTFKDGKEVTFYQDAYADLL